MADNGAAPAGSPDAAGNAAAGAEGVSVAAAGAGEGAGAGAPAAADCGGAASGTQADASGTSAGAGAGDATEAAGAKGGGGEAAGEATVVATQTLQVLDTRLTADCVEACPATFDGCSDVVVLGTYELNTETRVKSGQLTVFTVRLARVVTMQCRAVAAQCLAPWPDALHCHRHWALRTAHWRGHSCACHRCKALTGTMLVAQAAQRTTRMPRRS